MPSSIRIGGMKLAPRTILPIATAVAAGIFISVASHALAWSSATTWVVGAAMAALLGLFGAPLLLLPLAPPVADGRSPSTDDGPLAAEGLAATRSQTDSAGRDPAMGRRSTAAGHSVSHVDAVSQ